MCAKSSEKSEMLCEASVLVKRVAEPRVVDDSVKAAIARAAHAGDLSGATDCASLVERQGGTVVIVDGDPRLAKVTTRDDLERVSQLLETEER